MRWMWMLVVAAGCSSNGGGGGDDGPCTLATSASGAATWSFDGSPACVIPFGGQVDIDMDFLPIDAEPKGFEVYVSGVMAGQTGTFSAMVTATTKAGQTYRTPATCMVTITEHSDTGASTGGVGETYQVVGEGSCAAPATEVGGSSTLVIDPFAFRFPAHW